MHLAAQGGHMLVAGLLISRSADSLVQADKQGRTAVHLASAHGHVDMVGLLLGQGAEINAQDKVIIIFTIDYNTTFNYVFDDRNNGLLCTMLPNMVILK